MNLNAHFDRLKLAGVFYGTAVTTLVVTGNIGLTPGQIFLGGAAVAATGAYYHHARRLV